jgi:hypothetical protein
MLGISLRETQVFSTLAVAGIVAGCAAVYALMSKSPSPDEVERDRRMTLVRSGRIIDATVLDISDLSPEESGRSMGLQLILYQYDVSGVIYECSQDVTLLKNIVDIHAIRLSFPASVRYDPHSPGNSIIVAEGWSGLRDTANSVPLHPLRRNSSRHASA